MPWHRDSITQGEIDALYQSARRAWSDDTRYPLARSSRRDSGQCYVTAAWLRERLGGSIGKAGGHYAWVSPDNRYVLDLAPHAENKPYYGENKGFERVEAVANERTERFAKRADEIFDNLPTLLKMADLVGDAYPGEEPQAVNDAQYLHDEPNYQPAEGEYRFVYADGQLEVSPSHKHEELVQHTGIHPNHRGPMAMGYVVVTMNKAAWEVDSNVNVKSLSRVFKEYTKHVGWDWGGITHIDGEPISDDFAPKKGGTYNYVYNTEDDHLWIGHSPPVELALRIGATDPEERLHVGRLRVVEGSAYAEGSLRTQGAVRSLYEFCEDQGLILYAGNDNVIETIPDLQEDNLGANKEEFDKPLTDDREPSGVYKCPVCERLFPGWHEYSRHRREEAEDYGDQQERDGKFPELNPDATHPPHFTEMQPAIMPVARREAARVDGFKGGEGEFFVAYLAGSPVGYARLSNNRLVDLHAACDANRIKSMLQSKIMVYTGQEPKDLLEGPVPFIYDVEEDSVTVGKPGKRTSDIPGRFTPGGIVEGSYEPGGKVVLHTMTNMPYTVRHMIELWYYQHPELEVKSVHLQDEAGGTTKLATEDVGSYIKTLVAADPSAYAATRALQEAGGNVFAVGGAVRDAIMGKEPNDIDLMVQGLDGHDVNAILEGLPGMTKMTGKDFGVFRYKERGAEEVEIALPRKERSTGGGHKDFIIDTDPHMRPEEDLYRRDFTANAMAVNLANGKLLDPYNGTADVQNGVLRTHNPDSLSEDPLRVVRALVANAKHGLVPDDETRKRMSDSAASLTHLPPERIQSELDKLFASKDPAKAMRLAHETGVLEHIFPEAMKSFGFDQNNPHHELMLGDHLLKVLERTAEKTDDPDVRLAGFLHDIGKPDSAWVDPDRGTNHYYQKRMPDGTIVGADHETVGAELARNALTRLRYPADRIKRVSELVSHHMWPAFTTEKGARKYLNRVGPHAYDLMDLRWADQGGKHEYPTDPGLNLEAQRNLMEQVINSGQATDKSALAIDGNDLIRAGIPQGPQIGTILQRLTEDVLEDPTQNNRKSLLTRAQGYVTL